MKHVVFGGLFLSAVCGAYAFGEVGQWSTGYAQGVTEYTAVVSNKTNLYIACDEYEKPVSMTLTVDGKDYGSGANKGFDFIIDGKEIQTPYETASRVGANNFIYAWDAIRKAKTLQAKTADGKLVDLPLKGAAKVLPKTTAKAFSCKVDA